MYYEFEIGSFILGVIILIIGGLIVAFYQQISDNLLSGVSSYDKTKLWGLIICGLGIVIMTGLHSIVLNWLVSSLFKI